ncbi:APC family permease [Pseudogulbenkiania ferrooxidans]|uniref:Amino acid permease-associated region n=1 Tax=Pseudogulbenkiania ferrooxidans 2002 TaxID=279714 RepID=B9YYX5_9NEIS|nr:APC family permease [Pseudogulbenkiania ferrooxidans]EEG10328.1 amino acid permease-associated region [Pseudogulbenkiania ferrooxidans 2002]
MNHQHSRHIGPIALMLTGLGSIIGSGWLFGAAHAAQIAGPAAIVAWLVGMVIILSIALSYAELGAMFPESGGMVRYARYSHGSLLGFIAAWANWIAIVAVIPIEAEASVQYMSSWPWPWAQALYQHGELNPTGLGIAAVLVVVYFLLNYWGVKLFAKANSAITVFKLVVPALTALALIDSGFHSGNLGSATPGGFAPFGWASVMTAVATSGIVFSFNGFQSPINLAGEARNPGKSIPFGVIGSILLAAVIYVLLQVAFLGALTPADLAHGWQGIDFSSPFAQLALAFGLNWLVMTLYFDAFVSPSGTGATYMATTSRMIYGMQKNGTMPALFGHIHPLYRIPRAAMWFNLAVSFMFLFFFRGWGTLAAVISVATVISYLTGPISAASLRRAAPDLPRPLRLAGLNLIAPFAFVCASLVLYWARWPLTGQIIFLIVAALPVYFWYQAKAGWPDFGREVKGALWMVLYLPALALLSYVGSTDFGGIGLLPYGVDMAVVALMALGFYAWGVNSGWRTRYLEQEHDAAAVAAMHEASQESKRAGRLAGQNA